MYRMISSKMQAFVNQIHHSSPGRPGQELGLGHTRVRDRAHKCMREGRDMNDEGTQRWRVILRPPPELRRTYWKARPRLVRLSENLKVGHKGSYVRPSDRSAPEDGLSLVTSACALRFAPLAGVRLCRAPAGSEVVDPCWRAPLRSACDYDLYKR